MQTKTKIGIGIGVAVVLIAAVLTTNTDLFKGALQLPNLPKSQRCTFLKASCAKDDKKACEAYKTECERKTDFAIEPIDLSKIKLPPKPIPLPLPPPPPIATPGSLAVTVAPTSPPSTLFAGTNQEVELAHFNLSAAVEGIQITDVVITNSSTAATSFYSVRIFIDGNQLGGYENFRAAINGTSSFTGLSYIVPAGTTKTLVVKAKPVSYPSGTANSDHTIRIGAHAITARGVVSGVAINAPGSPVDAHTHSWARTSLTATGGVVSGHCTTSCVRSSSDEILALSFTSGAPYGATLRGALQANDEAVDKWVGTGTIAVTTINYARFVDGDGGIQVTERQDNAPVSLYHDFGRSYHLLNYSKASFWLWTDSESSFVFKACNGQAGTPPLGVCPQVTPLNVGAAGQLSYIEVDLNGSSAETRFFGVEEVSGPSTLVIIDDFRLWNDAITINFSGMLKSMSVITGTTVEMVDASNIVRAVGYVKPLSPTSAKAVLTVGSDIGNVASRRAPDLIFSNFTSSYHTVRTNTNALMANDTPASETLSVSVNLGGPTTNGDIRWYDGAVGTTSPLTWVSGTTPITAIYAY